MKCKMQNKPCRRKKVEPSSDEVDEGIPKDFGDIITADHIIIGDAEDESRHGDMTALIIQDRATRWLDCYPAVTKSAANTVKSLQHFVGPQDQVKLLYSDGAHENGAASDQMAWRHDIATPNRPQTNGVAERAVKRVLEGTRTTLYASGLGHI